MPKWSALSTSSFQSPSNYYGLGLILAIFTLTATYLAFQVIPIGEGPDELSHISHAFYKYKYGAKPISNREGLYLPAVSPSGQGHQPPVYYWLGSSVFRLFVDRSEIPDSPEFGLGLAFVYDNHLVGGSTRCTYSLLDRSNEVPAFERLRYGAYSLRIVSALLACLIAYLASVCIKKSGSGSTPLAITAALFSLSFPTTLWRAAIINNDNAVVILSSVTCFIGFLYLRKPRLPLVLPLSVCAALAFLSKYNGIAAVGMALLAILLSPTALREKTKAAVVALLFILALVASDLRENLLQDGDVLSSQVLQEIVPALYKPGSYLSVLTNTGGLHEVWTRIWLTFHNTGSLDPQFDLRHFWIWKSISIVLLLTTIGGVFSPSSNRLWHRRVTVYLLGCVLGVFAVWVHFASGYPIAGGRYVHTALLPYTLLVVGESYALLRTISPKRAALISFAVVAAFAAYGWTITVANLQRQFASCRDAKPSDVPAGVEVLNANLGEPASQGFLFASRYENQVFFLRHSSEGFHWEPRSTRRFALTQHDLFSDDLNGDGQTELISWLREEGLLSYIDGRTLSPDVAETFSGLASKDFTRYRPFPRLTEWKLQVHDTNGDDRADLTWSDLDARNLLVAYTQAARKFVDAEILSSKKSNLLATPDLTLLTVAGRTIAVARTPKKRLRFQELDSGDLHAFEIPEVGELSTVRLDLDDDTDDELGVFREGEPCLRVYDFPADADSPIKQLQTYCVDGIDLRYGSRVVPLSAKIDGRKRLYVFDSLQVALYEHHQGEWERISPDWF